jgi:putative redox protein
VALLHGAGYAGGELIRLLNGHPHFSLAVVTSRSAAGRPVWHVHPALRGQTDLVFTDPDHLSLDGISALLIAAEHGQSVAVVQALLADVIAAWAQRYLVAEPAAAQSEAPAAVSTSAPARSDATIPEGAVQGVERGPGAFTVDIRAGRHQWVGDEPASVGGDDLGPGPYDMLTAALGACTAMTLRMYARQKQWPLDKVTVELAHSKIHAKDCAECETRDGKVDRIERFVTITGALDAEQRQRLLEIADKCPVHRTLHSDVLVVTRAADAEAGAAG